MAVEPPARVLPDDALVCRGGTCSADRFRHGSGVSIDDAGRLASVFVNSAAATTLALLTARIPNRVTGVTKVGAIRRVGGIVTPAPSANNGFHCLLGGITPDEAARLFSPVVPNPNR